MRNLRGQLFNRRSFEPRLKVRELCGRALCALICTSFPILAKSSFTTDTFYRADVTLAANKFTIGQFLLVLSLAIRLSSC